MGDEESLTGKDHLMRRSAPLPSFRLVRFRLVRSFASLAARSRLARPSMIR